MMHSNELNKKYHSICRMVYRRRLADALVLLRGLISEADKEFLQEELNRYEETYTTLLKHTFEGVEDPEREKIYQYLQRSILAMADNLKEDLLVLTGSGNVAMLKRSLGSSPGMDAPEAMEVLESAHLNDELSTLLNDAKVGAGESREEHQRALEKLFNMVWLTDMYSEEEIRLLQTFCDSDYLPWHQKSPIVSALTLSILRFFDVNKFQLLLRFLEKKERRVWERALIGLYISCLKYDGRLPFYPQLMAKLDALKDFPDIEKHLEAITVQFVKSRETEQVRKKWEEEIMPAMMKMRPRIEQSLDLDNIFSDFPGEDKNPDWETVFEDAPGFLDKLQELTEMQMDGMDVFISTFAQLKHFPFFRQLSNWFLPFYAENPAIEQAVSTPDDAPDLRPLVDKLDQTYFMCNSDKYSFCLNLERVPVQQKTMMMNMLSAEMKTMSELEKDEDMLNATARSARTYTQYFQDLYRFYKLHPWRGEFDDIFSMEADLFEANFFRILVSDKKTIRNIAELFFDKHFYRDALGLFLSILEKDKSNIELFEKIAFCYEKMGDLEKAYGWYHKADLIETGRPWILKKMAFCCKYMNKWEQAFLHYDQAARLEPEDMKLQAAIGQCLIHLERYAEALDSYFKVEVMAPENHKIRRPLAWCSFILGKFEVAADYLTRLMEMDPGNEHDLMNLGHVLWCEGKSSGAFEKYLESLKTGKKLQSFVTSFNEDKKHLAAHGLHPMDMDLMLDYLKLEYRRQTRKS